jgi:hypothetical protein
MSQWHSKRHILFFFIVCMFHLRVSRLLQFFKNKKMCHFECHWLIYCLCFWVGYKQVDSFLVFVGQAGHSTNKNICKILIKLLAKFLKFFFVTDDFSLSILRMSDKSQQIVGHCSWCCSKWCFASNAGWK